MNYKKIHDSIIERAKNREINCYVEKHHIVPKCLGGENNKENIVKLRAKEHFIIHRLLIRMYPDEYRLVYALFSMCMRGKYNLGRILPSAKIYEQVKTQMSEATKKRLKEQNPWKGKKHSEESKRKQREAALVRKITKENELKRREGISKSNKKPKSAEHIKHISEAKLGNKNPMFGKKYKIIDGKRIFYIP